MMLEYTITNIKIKNRTEKGEKLLKREALKVVWTYVKNRQRNMT